MAPVWRMREWRAWPVEALPEFGTAKMAGVVSAILFVLCGLMVAILGPLVPSGPHVHRWLIVAVGVTAVLSGFVIGSLPWQRWRRSSSLWLIPLSCALVAVHNVATGANGFRYDVFFLVVFVWIGLMHPAGTSLKSAPALALAYLAPGIWLHNLSTLAGAMTYTLPVCLLVGECASLVSSRVQRSEAVVRANEERLLALVTNASDVITVVDHNAVVKWDSPSITRVLGYAPDDRVGRLGLDYLHPDHLPMATEALASLIDDPDTTRQLELQVRHKDGSWRWIDVRVRNRLDDPAIAGLVVNMTDVTERHEADDVRRQLAAIVESTTDAIVGQRLDGTIVSWNSAAERMFSYPAEQMLGSNASLLWPAELETQRTTLVATVAAGDAVDNVETRHVRRDGSVVDVALSMSPVRDAAGRVTAIAAIARDITAQVQARVALADSESSFRLLFAANPQPMWVYDAHTLQFIEVNDAAVRHYGYSRERFLTLHITDIRPLEDVETLIEEIGLEREYRETDGWRHLLADGRVIDVEITSHKLQFGGRDAVLVAVRDVTDRNALDAQLRHQAFHDSLTGLSNRALFNDRVEHALGRRSGSKPVVLLLDLDQFKLVNDSLGHATGDEMLVEVARRLEDSVRLGDTVARLGGDEFAILLEECPQLAAEQQAVRLLEVLAEPMHLGGHQVNTTASIGIAVATSSVSAGELLRNADVAMYRAKAGGGGRYQIFQPAMYAAAARQMELTGSLRRAIADEEFVLHFQPVVDLTDGHVTSLEALVRWEHPELGVMSPAEFVPIAEESGLIVELGEWVLREACRAAASWPDNKVRVNVNLSGRQLADPHIVDHVRAALRQTGLPASRLTLEITESVLMQHSEANVRRLRRLRALGVSLAIDDFGTGYSSLAYLRAFPVHELKIDKTFVAALPDDEEAVALVHTILQLARSLSLRAVAEGVETAAQYDALRGLGCDRAQGYFVSRPQPWADAVAVATGARRWHVGAAVPTQR